MDKNTSIHDQVLVHHDNKKTLGTDLKSICSYLTVSSKRLTTNKKNHESKTKRPLFASILHKRSETHLPDNEN